MHSATHRLHSKWPKDGQSIRQAIYGFQDTLQDSASAIIGYGFAQWPEDVRQKLLYIYGFLQALYIQQDSVKYFTKYANPDIKICGSAIKNVREVRNSIAGHPHPEKNHQRHRATFLHLASLRKDEWSYTSEKPKSFRPIAMATDQAKELQPFLSQLVDCVRRDWGHVFSEDWK